MRRGLLTGLLILCMASQLTGCSLKDKVISKAENYASAKFRELSNDEEFIEKFNTVCDRGANIFISVVFKERPVGEVNE